MNKRALILGLVLVCGCVPAGQNYNDGGGHDPGAAQPAGPSVDVNGQWHAESAEDGTGRSGKGSVWISQIGTLITARLTGSTGGPEINIVGSVGADGSFQANYTVQHAGAMRQATMSGQIRSRSEISGRWTIPGQVTGTFRWVR